MRQEGRSPKTDSRRVSEMPHQKMRDFVLTLSGERGPRYPRHGHPSMLTQVLEGFQKLDLGTRDRTDPRAPSRTAFPAARFRRLIKTR